VESESLEIFSIRLSSDLRIKFMILSRGFCFSDIRNSTTAMFVAAEASTDGGSSGYFARNVPNVSSNIIGNSLIFSTLLAELMMSASSKI